MTRSPLQHGCRVCEQRFATALELLFHERHEHGAAVLREGDRRASSGVDGPAGT